MASNGNPLYTASEHLRVNIAAGVDAHTACCVCGGGDALSVPEVDSVQLWML